ncbi:MAG: hypothetical protein KME22_31085 [Hassallia sp. WJT32-NPBG1]|jgi:DNA-binding NarL/FixJ family response regulator|nr:hypothetical protein [Hassallia sp. WJT32-NPBG1]
MIARSDIENIRKAVKQSGDYKPTAQQIREAILKVCPNGKNIRKHKREIVQSVIKMQDTKNKMDFINLEQPIEIETNTETQINTAHDPRNQIQPVSDSSQTELDNTRLIDTNNIQPGKSSHFVQSSGGKFHVISDLSNIVDESFVDEILSQESGEVVETSSIVFSTEQKQDLITTQASVLGIELSEVEVDNLASTVGDKFTDYAEFVREVTSAIKTYADHHYDSLEQSIENTHEDLKNHFTYRERQLNQKFADGLGEIKSALESSRKSLKITKTAILSRLNIKGA